MKKTVIIQIEIEGFHNYPNAPKEVNFLSHNHRHSFKIKVGYRVNDLNREKEIFLCRDEVKSYLFNKFGNPCKFNAMSCEMIASEIIKYFEKDDVVWCEVWEENTGGARIEL